MRDGDDDGDVDDDADRVWFTRVSLQERRSFDARFGGVWGGWCCAPDEDLKKGMPRSARFSLLKA
eukprot:3781957-Pleurochrysis_carterae.AAC.4